MLLAGNHTQIINPTILNDKLGHRYAASYVQVTGGLLYNCGDVASAYAR